MKEKELKYLGNGDANSHVCKVCFESPTAAILLPCRHFCCKSFPILPESISLNFVGDFPLCLQFFVRILIAYRLILQCVNLVHLLVLSVQYAAEILQIGFLLLHRGPSIIFYNIIVNSKMRKILTIPIFGFLIFAGIPLS